MPPHRWHTKFVGTRLNRARASFNQKCPVWRLGILVNTKVQQIFQRIYECSVFHIPLRIYFLTAQLQSVLRAVTSVSGKRVR